MTSVRRSSDVAVWNHHSAVGPTVGAEGVTFERRSRYAEASSDGDDATSDGDGTHTAGPAARATLLAAAGGSGVGYGVGFRLGAFGVVMFQDMLTAWVVATIALVGSLVSPLPPRHWAGRTVLFLPSVWVLLAFTLGPTSTGIGTDVVGASLWALTIVTLLTSGPVAACDLACAVMPSFESLPTKNRITVLGTIVLFSGAGFVMGLFNNHFLLCEDFRIAGNFEPHNCTPGGPVHAVKGPKVIHSAVAWD